MADIHPFLQPITSNNGLYRPYRVFRNVGKTFVQPTVRAGQTTEIVDTLNLGMVYTITSIRIKSIVKPAISTTITVKANGITIFTKTILVANLGLLGALVDMIGLDTPMPADLTLPVTLTCAVSDGVYDIIIDGLEN